LYETSLITVWHDRQALPLLVLQRSHACFLLTELSLLDTFYDIKAVETEAPQTAPVTAESATAMPTTGTSTTQTRSVL
jgi:hypothetical protein